MYDNYSKLIAATDTIRRMRASMEPLAPTTGTLEPAIRHIEDISRELAAHTQARAPRPPSPSPSPSPPPSPPLPAVLHGRRRQRGVDTVRWALDAPPRIHALAEAGRRDEALAVRARVHALCDLWDGTAGVAELRARADSALAAVDGCHSSTGTTGP